MNEDKPLEGEIIQPADYVGKAGRDRVGKGFEGRKDEIEPERIVNGDRMEYAKMMADMLACAPSIERMKEWAAKYPDRYFYSLKLIGGMVGLAERVEHHGTIIHTVANMSDSEIMKRLEEMKVEMLHPLAEKKNEPAKGT